MLMYLVDDTNCELVLLSFLLEGINQVPWHKTSFRHRLVTQIKFSPLPCCIYSVECMCCIVYLGIAEDRGQGRSQVSPQG